MEAFGSLQKLDQIILFQLQFFKFRSKELNPVQVFQENLSIQRRWKLLSRNCPELSAFLNAGKSLGCDAVKEIIELLLMMDERVLCQQALMVLWQNLVSTGSFIEQLAIITGKVDFGWSKNISSRESSYHVQAEHKKESQKPLIRF